MTRRPLTACLLALLLAGLTGRAGQCRDLYVDATHGNNLTADGTAAKPFKHISMLYAKKLVAAGDTIHLAPGTYTDTPDADDYREQFPIKLDQGISMIGESKDSVILLGNINSSSVISAISKAPITIVGLTVRHIQSANDQSGIDMASSNGNIINCIITNNAVGIMVHGDISTYKTSTIIRNCTINTNGSGVSGAYTYYDNLFSNNIISNCTISNNSTGISTNHGRFDIVNNKLFENIRGISLDSIEVYIRNNEIYNNRGNGISGNATYCNIYNNNINDNGNWGIFWWGNGEVYAHDNYIYRNSLTAKTGGGIFLYLNSGGGHIWNNVVYKNAGATGAGILIQASPTPATQCTITHCTIAENQSQDGSIYINNKNTTVENCIISGATDDGGTGGYAMYEPTTDLDHVAIHNCLFWNNKRGLLYAGVMPVKTVESLNTDVTGASGNLGADPKFVAPGADNYHLSPGSPAIDAAVAGQYVPTNDIEAHPRPFGPRSDLGAYELIYNSCAGAGWSRYE